MSSIDLLRSRAARYLYRAVLVLAIFLWTFGLLHGCGPSRATRTALDELHRLGAECEAHALAIGETAPSLAEGRALLAQERERCIAHGHTYCAEHHLDCSEVLP